MRSVPGSSPIPELGGVRPVWTTTARAGSGHSCGSGRVSVRSCRSGNTAQPRRNKLSSSTIRSTGTSRRDRAVIDRIRSRACWTALCEGHRPRNTKCADRGVRPRTSLLWKPRKSTPRPPSTRCTMRVLDALGSSPRSPSRTVNRSRAAWACSRDRHITTRPPHYADRRIYADRGVNGLVGGVGTAGWSAIPGPCDRGGFNVLVVEGIP